MQGRILECAFLFGQRAQVPLPSGVEQVERPKRSVGVAAATNTRPNAILREIAIVILKRRNFESIEWYHEGMSSMIWLEPED